MLVGVTSAPGFRLHTSHSGISPAAGSCTWVLPVSAATASSLSFLATRGALARGAPDELLPAALPAVSTFDPAADDWPRADAALRPRLAGGRVLGARAPLLCTTIQQASWRCESSAHNRLQKIKCKYNYICAF